MADVILAQVAKRFGAQTVLTNLDLAVRHGEFLTIVGPSGSGKSTLLRLIAGLEAPDAGRILIDGRVVCGDEGWVPPQHRAVGMVFQHYALWPHMTALENVAFPLAMAGLARRNAEQRAREVLAVVELTNCAQKWPGQMSGGEQQRVALARAIAARPAILLLDECLSNLDAQLREKMAGEIRRVQEATGVTAIYVTHDPREAFAMADRVAVLGEGRIQQIDRPAVVYAHPRTPVVGTALGNLNVLRASQALALGLLAPAQATQLGLSAPAGATTGFQAIGVSAADPLLGLRPEHLQLHDHDPAVDGGPAAVAGRIVHAVAMNDECHCRVRVGPYEVQAHLHTSHIHPVRGAEVWVSVAVEDWIVLEG